MTNESPLSELGRAYHQATREHIIPLDRLDEISSPGYKQSAGYWRSVWRHQARGAIDMPRRSYKVILLALLAVAALAGSLYGLYQLELATHVPFPHELTGTGTPPVIHWQGK